MELNEELKNKIEKFNTADYPKVGEHLNFKECLKILTQNSETELIIENEKAFIDIGKRRFEIIDVYCPDLKETNAFIFDEAAKIQLSKGKNAIVYSIGGMKEIEKIEVFQEDENGYFELNGKKYNLQNIIESSKAKEGIDEISLDD